MKSKLLFLALVAISVMGCSKVESESNEMLWRSPAGIVMEESDIPFWEERVAEFKESIIAQQTMKIKPTYYTSRACTTPEIPCGLKCVTTTKWREADCTEAFNCLPCGNCCGQTPF